MTNPKQLDPERIVGEKILETIPGKGGTVKGVIKQLAYDIPETKPKKITRLPCPVKYENKIHWRNRCMAHNTMQLEW